jgi:hypothetical protein
MGKETATSRQDRTTLGGGWAPELVDLFRGWTIEGWSGSPC